MVASASIDRCRPARPSVESPPACGRLIWSDAPGPAGRHAGSGVDTTEPVTQAQRGDHAKIKEPSWMWDVVDGDLTIPAGVRA